MVRKGLPWKVTLEDLKGVREEEGHSQVRALTGSSRGLVGGGPARGGPGLQAGPSE